jgi:hypothetical protein
VDSTPATTDIAGYCYQGYGFKLWAPTGPANGQASVLLDGVNVGTVDFYSAAAAASSCLLTVQNVQLGLHTLNLVPLMTKDGGSSGYNVLFDALQVMR